MVKPCLPLASKPAFTTSMLPMTTTNFTMGFMNFLKPSQPPSLASSSLFFSLTSWFSSSSDESSKTVAQDVSFVLTTPCNAPRRPQYHSSQTPKPAPLPLELVFTIIEMACYDDGPVPDHHLLRQCALVSKAWSGAAQKLLFSDISLRSQAACDSFSKAVNRSTTRGRALGDSVTRLRITVDPNQPFGVSQTAFAHAVTLCPNLYELSLALYGSIAPGQDVVGAPNITRLRRLAPLFDEETLSQLRFGPMIKALQFNNWSENQHSVTQLLDVWPSLKTLAMGGTPPLPPSPFLEPFGCCLEEVRMNFQTTPSLDFVNWLLHNSADTLRILELEREPSAHFLDHVISTYGSSLLSLAVPSFTAESVSVIRRCSQLKELRVESPLTAPKLYKDMPAHLEHLAVGINRSTVLQPVIDTIKSSESMKVFTVNLCDGGDQHTLFNALKLACAYQGVELRIIRDFQTFRSVVRGDPVSTSSFPRTHCLENLYQMRS